MTIRTKILGLALCAPLAFSAIADDGQRIFTSEKVSGELGLGTLSGKTKERVYDPELGGHKDSQLNWKYANAAVVKGAFDWDLLPWVSLGATGWTTIASRGGYMDDTDWPDESSKQWSDQSRHPNTRLNYANQFDVNLKGWLFNEPD